MECISMASATVLVNGSPSGEFSLERGLRQGNPLSPFLFLIAAEGLGILMEKASDLGRELKCPTCNMQMTLFLWGMQRWRMSGLFDVF